MCRGSRGCGAAGGSGAGDRQPRMAVSSAHNAARLLLAQRTTPSLKPSLGAPHLLNSTSAQRARASRSTASTLPYRSHSYLICRGERAMGGAARVLGGLAKLREGLRGMRSSHICPTSSGHAAGPAARCSGQPWSLQTHVARAGDPAVRIKRGWRRTCVSASSTADAQSRREQARRQQPAGMQPAASQRQLGRAG